MASGIVVCFVPSFCFPSVWLGVLGFGFELGLISGGCHESFLVLLSMDDGWSYLFLLGWVGLGVVFAIKVFLLLCLES